VFRMLAFAAVVLVPPAAAAAPAEQFVRDAVQGNVSEVALGRLIASRGATPQVRDFGSVLVRDHGRGLAQALALAARLRIPAPAVMTPGASRELQRLRRLNGRAFDLEVRTYMIQDHRNDLAEFRAQVRSGDRRTIGFAAATIPVLERHLALAQSIRG
jgi:putative membrane protein